MVRSTCWSLALTWTWLLLSQQGLQHAVSQVRARDNSSATSNERRFEFAYAGKVTGLKPGQTTRVWLPVARSNEHQSITRKRVSLPAEFRETTEKRFGNRLIYFEAEADQGGEVPIEIVYDVTRREVTPDRWGSFDPSSDKKYLRPSSLVPADRRVLRLLLPQPQGTTLQVARQLYDAVDAHMSYDKPDGGDWGRGDAMWACDSGFGNCTDFHSLFMSAAYQLSIPTKFEIGFPLPGKPGSGSIPGYHCWASFVANDQWVPVDISEADKDPTRKDYFFGRLTTNRVSLTVGRDLVLDPAASAPVNFLVYPYVEVNGKPHSGFQKQFKYRDL